VFHAKAAEEHAAFYSISLVRKFRPGTGSGIHPGAVSPGTVGSLFEEIAPERAVFFYSQNPGMEVVDDVETSVSSVGQTSPPTRLFRSVLKGLEASSPVCFSQARAD